MKIRRWTTTTLTLAALVATPAAAQQAGAQPRGAGTCPGMGMMMMGGEMMGGARRGEGMSGMMHGQSGMHGQGMTHASMASGADVLLGAADQLGLSADQTARITEIRDQAAEDMDAAMGEMMDAHQAASQALEGDAPDLAGYERALGRAAGAMVQARVAAARATVDARAVLTPDQRGRIAEDEDLAQALRCGMMGSAMPMMQRPR